MRTSLLLITLALAGAAVAKEHDYEKGTLIRMDSTACGMQEKGAKSLTGELLGTDAQSKRTQELLCQEYVLQGDRVEYHIRPKDDKHRFSPSAKPPNSAFTKTSSSSVSRNLTAKSANTWSFP
jgi:hypothetical protein